MSYIVWCNNHTEGWWPSEELETIAECYTHVLDQCSRDFVITSGEIKVKFSEENA